MNVTTAENAVEPIYVFNDEIASHRSTFVLTMFDIVLDVKAELEKQEESHSTGRSTIITR